MGLFFKFGLRRYLNFFAPRKGVFLDKISRELSGMAPKRRFLIGFLQFSGKKTLITLSKMTQNLKVKACFMQNIMELDIRKLLNPKAVTSGLGPKN